MDNDLFINLNHFISISIMQIFTLLLNFFFSISNLCEFINMNEHYLSNEDYEQILLKVLRSQFIPNITDKVIIKDRIV